MTEDNALDHIGKCWDEFKEMRISIFNKFEEDFGG